MISVSRYMYHTGELLLPYFQHQLSNYTVQNKSLQNSYTKFQVYKNRPFSSSGAW